MAKQISWLYLFVCPVLSIVPSVGAALNNHQEDQAAVVEVKIVAERFQFKPSRITVKTGAILVLRLSSRDVVHGFGIPAAEIDVKIPAKGDGEVIVKMAMHENGEYDFECTRKCGAGHLAMRGVIIVE